MEYLVADKKKMANPSKGKKTGSVFTETKKTGKSLFNVWGSMKKLGDTLEDIDKKKGKKK